MKTEWYQISNKGKYPLVPLFFPKVHDVKRQLPLHIIIFIYLLGYTLRVWPVYTILGHEYNLDIEFQSVWWTLGLLLCGVSFGFSPRLLKPLAIHEYEYDLISYTDLNQIYWTAFKTILRYLIFTVWQSRKPHLFFKVWVVCISLSVSCILDFMPLKEI